jgi:endogenous inhibitor of DNA gyrase (YacG/DUF329 family)
MTMMRCAMCGKSFDPDESKMAPFCSKRCKQIDLGRWLNEEYGLPSEPEGQPERQSTPADDEQ